MSLMQAEVFEAFRDMGVAEDKAMRAASALSRRDEDIGALRSDMSVVKGDIATLKGDVSVLKNDVSVLKTEVSVLKWMAGTTLAVVIGVALKLFFH